MSAYSHQVEPAANNGRGRAPAADPLCSQLYGEDEGHHATGGINEAASDGGPYPYTAANGAPPRPPPRLPTIFNYK